MKKLIIAILILISPFLYFSYFLYMGYRRNNIPQDKIEYIETIITSESHYKGRDRYYYRFEINGKIYKGYIRDEDQMTSIGDYIKILYNKENPNINRPVVYHNQLIK